MYELFHINVIHVNTVEPVLSGQFPEFRKLIPLITLILTSIKRSPVSNGHVVYELHLVIGDLVSKETVCCVGGKVKH